MGTCVSLKIVTRQLAGNAKILQNHAAKRAPLTLLSFPQ
jgi:hypothetical protein